MPAIKVSVQSFYQLFNKGRKIVIPPYQRPYTWNIDKAEELLNDLEGFFLEPRAPKNYYLGTLLFFDNKREETLDVIDGQQRIATLLILEYLLKGSVPMFADIRFNSKSAARQIKQVQAYFIQQLSRITALHHKRFLSRVEFTTVITQQEDEAFVFFDTQNNRGIKLNAPDFLKAYHLRAIKMEKLQEECARDWEKKGGHFAGLTFLQYLFDKILWRARNWKGQHTINFENRDLILETFQKKSLKSTEPDKYPVYPGLNNRYVTGITWKVNIASPTMANAFVTGQSLQDQFVIRQPIYRGVHFFKYTEKYAVSHKKLFIDRPLDINIKQMRAFYDKIYTHDMSGYLREFFQLVIIMYYDLFRSDNLLKAAVWFDYLIGSVRVAKQQVKKEAVKNLLMDQDNNILDVVAHAFMPEEIFDFIYHQPTIAQIYTEEKIETGEGVRGRYKERLLGYFKQQEADSLQNRALWQ